MRERGKRASAPETHIFMLQKCDISVWPIATPSAIIVNAHCLHHYTASIKYILYIKFQKYCFMTERIRNYNISMGNFTL